MDSDQFETLVRSLEMAQQQRPRLFLWITGLLAALGYFYLLLVLMVCLALTFGLVVLVIAVPNALTLKLALVLGVLFGGLSWAILRSLWIRMRVPEGLVLDRQNAHGLFEMVETLRGRIGSTRIHKVLLSGEYNASVMQLPLLGMFGWHRNYLMLGLPLMQSMKPKEFEAVLAHEFAHLAGGHGRIGNWLYRLRRSWEALVARLAEQQNGGAKVLTSFLSWFWPRFNARAFVLSRANEYEADALAARLAGSENIAAALKRLSVYDRHLDESFWNRVFRRATSEPEPPSNIYAEIPSVMREGPAKADAEKWMRQAFLINTTTADTHPCLRERLEALEQLPDEPLRGQMPALEGPSAAESLLGHYERELAADLGRRWALAARPTWVARHQETKALASVIESTPNTSDTDGAGNVDALWKRADAMAGLEGIEAAQPLIDQILVVNPDHAGALFARGSYRLRKDDPAGVMDVERAAEIDSMWEGQALEALGAFHYRHGNRQSLKDIERRTEAHSGEMVAAQAERASAELSDTYLKHNLSSAEIISLQTVFAAEPDIASVSCASKVTKHLRHLPMHVIAIRLSVPWWKLRLSSASQKLVDRVASKMDIQGTFLVFIIERELQTLGERIESKPNADIYRKTV